MAKGFPALLQSATGIINRITLLIADVKLALAALNPPVWGVYTKTGKLALAPDSITAIDYNKTFEILTYPIESGAFETYNKVQVPFETAVEMTKGGKVSDRATFIAKLEALTESLELVTIITPEQAFINVNIESFNYSRTSTNGVGLMTFTVNFKEVRVTVVRTGTNTKDTNAQAPTQAGTVQASPTTTAPVTT